MAQEKEEKGSVAVAEPAAKTRPAPRRSPPKQLPPYHVVLLDDDDHTVPYVVEMLGVIFGHEVEKAMQMTKEVDETGRVIVLTTHLERAELKRDQILAYGADPRLGPRSTGSMKAVVEPAE